jgi:hypothetical protein
VFVCVCVCGGGGLLCSFLFLLQTFSPEFMNADSFAFLLIFRFNI